ncbi:pilus assembly protein TadG-related protein [Actinosynnema sp.]|uniref:pilus assembly protein TadG-related protein n=1 Tax=Actinosynnema sp. TaxID=1872144 RepID=UPI003F87B1CD
MRGLRRQRQSEDGAIAITAALLISAVLLAVAAIGVDVARWYVEGERLQTAADAAALAGVVFLPDNFPRAAQAARTSAELNGYEDGVNAEVDVTFGAQRSQLRVSITTVVDNQFGAAIDIDTATVGREAVADYTSPAPMGSPCNVFGNEPRGTTFSGPVESVIPSGSASNCTSRPYFWAGIEGPQTDKQSGDRYSTAKCTRTFGCTTTGSIAGTNTEATYPEGYFFAVKVGRRAAAAAQPVTLQIYDPLFLPTSTACDGAPTLGNTPNDYTKDGSLRYAKSANEYCSGDTRTTSGSLQAPITSFVLREANEDADPLAGTPIAGCTAQFTGKTTAPTAGELTKGNSSYNDGYARLYHQWYKLCSFTPTRAGDYFLQVRTNVAAPANTVPQCTMTSTITCREANTLGSVTRNPVVFRNNPEVHKVTGNRELGEGANSFSLRAVSPSYADDVSVSGWSRMPMLQNAPNSTASFNLLRVLPGAAGQSIRFEFFDVADGSSDTGDVTVTPPPDATGSVKTGGLVGCNGARTSGATNKGTVVDLPGCQVKIANATHNGQVQTMSIPIPDDYDCDESRQTGCWFRVNIRQNGNITDFTTWDARLEGDPVRLIE